MIASMMKRIIIPMIVVTSLILSGCQGNITPSPSAANDLLTKILAHGTIIVATDADYAPQSKIIDGAKRAENTKCTPNEFTAKQLTGFDIAAAVEIAERLGVEACFVTPQWSQIISGKWDGRWDISIGSMAITPERLKVLYFAQPYYATPAAVFVHRDNVFSQPSDLSGKHVGVCAGCTYEDYLKGTLVIPGTKVDFVIKDAQITGYDVDIPALEDLSQGDGVILDGVLTTQPTGLQAIKEGEMPIRQLGEPVFFEYLAMAVDKKNNYNSFEFTVKVSEIVKQMHADGTLATLSREYYEMDYATPAAQFDIASLEQLP